jgi:hypothetical protein
MQRFGFLINGFWVLLLQTLPVGVQKREGDKSAQSPKPGGRCDGWADL